jgi:class 3 adenylate cyclase
VTFSIRKKLFVLLAGMTTVVLTGVLTQVTALLSEAILEKVRFDFGQTERVFQRVQGLRYDSLLDAAYLIGENSTFKANLETGDPPTVYFAVEEMANWTRVDLFAVTDADGQLMAWFGQPERFGENLADRPSIARVLRGEQRSGAAPELWHTDDGLFQVATVPVLVNYSTLIGTLTLGVDLRGEPAQLKGETSIDIAFFVGEELVDATAERLDEAAAGQIRDMAAGRIRQVLDSGDPSDVFEATIAGEETFAFVSPLGVGEPAYYVATADRASELALLTMLRDNIILAGVLSLVITVGLALVLGSRLSQPILRLVGGMNQVKAGDLSVTLQPSTKDEIGLLTSTFNDMIGNLRERLQLMKYVGSHTLEMIKDRDGGDVPLGGSRHELAVLFTDIRGFTSFSEKRDPEDVISMLNRYLGFQAQIVERWQGSVDKFVGDEMMALFTGDNALDQAVGCAQEIMRRVELEHATDPAPIHIGVGINCGPAILGNMGAQNRMDYTAIGATVNLGARLVSSAAPGQILIPADLVERLTVPVRVCRREAMTFKNLSQPIEVAQIDFDEEETPHA